MTEDNQIVRGAIDHLDDLLTSHESKTILPTSSAIEESTSKIFSTLPHHGYGYSFTANHIIADLTPGLNQASKSSRYYGFVTGGNTPIARLADHYVSLWDQNVAVHLPAESVTTIVEDQALRMLLSLFDLPVDKFPSRTFTTGATASNVLGLACGREYVLQWHADRAGVPYDPHAGLLGSCLAAGIAKIQILTTKPHSSLGKAASVVGLGSGCLVDVSTHSDGLRFDMSRLKRCLEKINTASIVVISCSEVNLGGFATSGLDEVSQIRRLCDKYGAWLHVDAGKSISTRSIHPNKSQHSACLQPSSLTNQPIDLSNPE